MSFPKRFLNLAFICASAVILPSCVGHETGNKEVTPTFAPKTGPAVSAPAALYSNAPPAIPKEHIAPGPTPAVTAPTIAVPGGPNQPEMPKLTGQAEALALEQVTLPAFINEVFANALKLTVQIDQQVTTRSDLVTLRTGEPLPAEELYRMASKVLANYGIATKWTGSVLRVVPSESLLAEMPEVIRSRALPELPIALRPIFQLVELHHVAASDMQSILSNAYGNKIRVFPGAKLGAILILGLPSDVRAAIEAVKVLDEARLAGVASLRITPVYWTAKRLASQVVTLLRAEGYDANDSAPGGIPAAILVIPIEDNNSIVLFAKDPKLIEHARHWIADLDQPANADPKSDIFVYQVQNTTASSLGAVVSSVLGGQARGAAAGQAGQAPEAQLERAGQTLGQGGGLGGYAAGGAPAGGLSALQGALGGATGAAGGGAGAQGAPSGRGATSTTIEGGARLVVDPARNDIIIVGSAQEYARVRPLLIKLDVPPLEVLIEVTVAEITLNDQTNFGVEWSLLNHIGGGYTQGVGTGVFTANNQGGATSPGIGLGATGLNYTILNGIGQVRFALNALAQNTHVSVLSTPRILAKSGAQASIQVGTEVPILTSQATSSQISIGGTSGLLQQVEYQQTGVLLAVQPVVHSGDRVDLTLSQEVSSANQNTTSNISSPQISNRTIKTDLTLGDGQTVVIGGLIQDTRTDGKTGVPYLENIPLLGALFRNQSVSQNRVETLVFITPYVISTDRDAANITQQFRAQMQQWPFPSTTLEW